MLRGMLATTIAMGLAATPAAVADDTDTVAFGDVCGDNAAYVQTPLASSPLPAGERSAQFDLEGVSVAPARDGVAVRFEMCAPVGSPEGLGGRSLVTRLPDECSLVIAVDEALEGELAASTRKTCHDDNDTGQCPLNTCTDVRFDFPLPADALAVDGDAITVTVPRDGLTGEAAAAFAPGALWSSVGAVSSEMRTMAFFYGEDIRASGPSGIDFAEGPASLTVR